MICPACSNDATEVRDSRPVSEGAVIRRRRQCPTCSYRFTTFEEPKEEPEARDTYRYRRDAEMIEAFGALSLDDATIVLNLARRLAGRDGPWAHRDPVVSEAVAA